MSTFIIDYGMGNLGSVVRAFRMIGEEAKLIRKPKELGSGGRIILPGVGNFSRGAENLDPFRDVLNERVLIDKVPFLGICLGMELLGESSEEGEGDGLGWIRGENVRFDTERKVPHMGWNSTKIVRESPISLPGDYYFAHSYHLACPGADVLMTTEYGQEFVSAVQRRNIFGVQFHPEKSHKQGLELLKGFLSV